MTISRIVFIVALLILATGALAQIDPDPNGIGVYFDEGATNVSITADITSRVNAYLILTNPSEVGGITYWKGFVLPDLPGSISTSAEVWGEPRFGVNSYIPMPGAPWVFFFVVIDTPQPLEQVTILADLVVFMNGETDPVGLYVGDAYYSKVGPEGPFVSCFPSSGSEELPVASINGDTPVTVESQAWGQLKSLFR